MNDLDLIKRLRSVNLRGLPWVHYGPMWMQSLIDDAADALERHLRVQARTIEQIKASHVFKRD